MRYSINTRRVVPVLAGLVTVLGASSAMAQEQCGSYPADLDKYACSCPAGQQSGAVWGSSPYTGDSNICAAAQHAGVIGIDGGQVVAVRGPDNGKYRGTTANGITSSDWSGYPYSFTFDVSAASVSQCGAFPDGVDSYTCSCPPGPGTGAVWGTSPYTLDSDICTAALHGGLITAENGGTVTVLRTIGLGDYRGTLNYNIQSRDWGPYDQSYVFDYNW